MDNIKILKSHIVSPDKNLFAKRSKKIKKHTPVPLSYWKDMRYICKLYDTTLNINTKVKETSIAGQYIRDKKEIQMTDNIAYLLQLTNELKNKTKKIIDSEKSLIKAYGKIKNKLAIKIIKDTKKDLKDHEKKYKKYKSTSRTNKNQKSRIFLITFFHELAHRLQHICYGDNYFKNYNSKNLKEVLRIEQEADRLAYYLWQEYIADKIKVSFNNFNIHRSKACIMLYFLCFY